MIPTEKKVYSAVEVQKILGLGRNNLYNYLEEVYKKQSPFRVLKIGRVYKIPKVIFDNWLNCVTSKEEYNDNN